MYTSMPTAVSHNNCQVPSMDNNCCMYKGGLWENKATNCLQKPFVTRRFTGSYFTTMKIVG